MSELPIQYNQRPVSASALSLRTKARSDSSSYPRFALVSLAVSFGASSRSFSQTPRAIDLAHPQKFGGRIPRPCSFSGLGPVIG